MIAVLLLTHFLLNHINKYNKRFYFEKGKEEGKMKILELNPYERPRERLKRLGVHLLPLRELLAILLSTGNKEKSALEQASEILRRFPSLEELEKATLYEMTQLNGIGEAKACKIKAALALARRLVWKEAMEKTRITGPQDVFEYCLPWIAYQEKEIFLALALNGKHRILRVFEIAKGTLLSCPVHPREVFRPLIREGSVAFIVAHNHPSSGDPEPSPEDKEITKRLKEGGELLGIPLLDHVIIGAHKYISLSAQGLL
ncbi:MAG: JAB domain-containing protein [Planctomycetota bacterium]|nr:MAG: JAB domain-containing protein [Planctomycetota bacterium]